MKNIRYKFLYTLIIFISGLINNLLAQTKHIVLVYSDVSGLINFFEPPYFNSKVGDTIIWIPGNKPIINHTITAKKFPLGAEPINFKFQLPSDTIFKYIVRFSGNFIYECTPHSPYMFGNITVTEPNGTMPENIKYQYTNADNTPQLAPNPAFNSVTFYQLDESIKYILKVYNDLGKLVKETSITEVNEFEMNISNFSEGTYTAHLAYCACKPQKNACKGAGKTLKFIKQ